MSNEEVEVLSTVRASDVLLSTDRDSVGVVRILSDDAGAPGDEREYKEGDELLVQRGQAEWVVAPVHLPSAGRRLDGNAETEATPADGVETFPPAEPTTSARRSTARVEGVVDAHSAEGLSERTAKARAAAVNTKDDGVTERNARLGGRGARSGPVTGKSDLPADQAPETDTKKADTKK